MRSFASLAALVAIVAPVPPAAAQKAPTLSWSAPATTGIVTGNRRFTSEGVELSGTLYLPRSARPVAAIVVTHSASSPLGSASLYDHLKAMMPALGIAVFTYDRRGSGGSGTQDAPKPTGPGARTRPNISPCWRAGWPRTVSRRADPG